MEENPPPPPPPLTKKDPAPEPPKSTWGGWGISPFSVFSDLQKAAAIAAEEISRNAAAAVKKIEEMQNVDPDPEPGKEDGKVERSLGDDEAVETEEDKRRKSALERLENASEDSILGQARTSFNYDEIHVALGFLRAKIAPFL